MIEPTLLSLYITALIAVYISPGPDMALVMAISAGKGRSAGLNTASGIAAARALHVLGSGLGLAALIMAHPYLENFIRVVGAIFLLYWGWKIFQTPLRMDQTSKAISNVKSNISRGFITNLLNPKALIFCSMLLPQFISSGENPLPQFIILGGILVCVGLIFDISYVFLADGMAQRMGNKICERTQSLFYLEKIRNWLMVFVFGGMAIRLLLG